jgi:Zn finger protein HypA/HybF involved in hydrogenase expression
MAKLKERIICNTCRLEVASSFADDWGNYNPATRYNYCPNCGGQDLKVETMV